MVTNLAILARILVYSKEDRLQEDGQGRRSTEFSKHVASNHRDQSDLEFTILCTDDNWFNRGVKEAIAIRKIRPTLNQDEGRHHLPKMYDQLINSCVDAEDTPPRDRRHHFSTD